MQITITDPSTNYKWKLEPCSNGLGYQIFKSSKEGAKSEWTFTGKYPNNIPHGVELIINGILSDPEGNESIECDPKHLNKTFKKYMDDFVQKVIESIEIK